MVWWLGEALAKVLNRLVHYNDFGLYVWRSEKTRDLRCMLFFCELCVERLKRILCVTHQRLMEQVVRAVAKKVYERTERDEFAERGHVDPVAVGVANRRRGRGDHDSLRAQPIEHRKNRVFHRVAAHYRVVEHDERIVLLDEPVGHVVDVLVELAPRRGVGDERAELRVLESNLSDPPLAPPGKVSVVRSSLIQTIRTNNLFQL